MTITHKPDYILNTTKKTLHLISLSVVVCSASASGNAVTFGSDNDGVGGFASDSTTPISPEPAWTTEAGGVRFTNDGATDSGQVNSSLFKEYNLSRTDGSSFTVTGVLDIVSTYAADNNRFGILIFADSGDLAGTDSGLSLQYNLGNGQFLIRNGVNGSVEDGSNTAYNGLNGASAIGTTFIYRADIAFVGMNIEIDFTLTDQDNFSQTVSAEVVADDFTGTYFGFGTRGRVRGTVPGTNDIPFSYEAKSFSVIDLSVSPILTIMPNATTPGHYDFAWTSQAGKEYDLVSNTDFSTAMESWPVWEGLAGLAATPPENVLADVPGGGDIRRFFGLVERDLPPLLNENFDDAPALPTGWTSTGPDNGTDWEVGEPSGVPSGPASAFTAPNCAGTNIGDYYTENIDVSLVSPIIAIPVDGAATLSFRQFIDTDKIDSTGDAGSVRVLDADNADTPIAGLELSGLQGLGSDGLGWTENTLALPAVDVGGKNIKIEFNFVSDAGTVQGTDVYGGFYVDDVSVSLD